MNARIHGLARAAGIGALAALIAASPGRAEGPDGKRLFTEATPPCAVCHTLAAANAEGAIGPSLDEVKPSAEQVAAALRSGPGAMPNYGDKLTGPEIDAIARYVAGVAGG